MSNLTIDSRLFTSAFDESYWKNTDKLSVLLASLRQVEKEIEDYLQQIRTDFPQLTDHSIDHSRMLWQYADLIVGDQEKEYLNPLEAYVLHIAFLIHDAGMCYSVLNNRDELEKEPLYLDYLYRLGDTPENREDAIFYTVRYFHGDHAFRAATEKLANGKYLIEDISLREELSSIIGLIAKSHSKSVGYVEREIGEKYTSPSFPTSWVLNCQKLSFILRVSDAAHLDNLRTPKTNREILEISGVSGDHWTFQKKLGFPTLEQSLLAYTSNVPFSKEEQRAWWLCLEGLKTLDFELKRANEYFATKGLPLFTAQGVRAVDNTLELGSKYIRTSGWQSVDSRVRVSQPTHLAAELGGVKLYGHPYFAVRELLQNCIDAIHLYRVVSEQDSQEVGDIRISLTQEGLDTYLSIVDNGIGMSQTVMTNELLDFGGSYWKSNAFFEGYAGVSAKGFSSIGEFGIGFFSVFMLGSYATVTSWKFGEGISEMKTLEFKSGLSSSPILREPTTAERKTVRDRGTAIRIRLSKPVLEKGGLLNAFPSSTKTLNSLVKYFVPFPDMTIGVIEMDGTSNTILPAKPEGLSLKDFLDNVYSPNSEGETSLLQLCVNLGLDLIELSDETHFYGKLVLTPKSSIVYSGGSIVLVHGIRVTSIHSCIGYLYADRVTAVKRESFQKNLPYSVLRKWVKEQILYIDDKKMLSLYSHVYYGLKVAFNLYDENTPIVHRKVSKVYALVSIAELRLYLATVEEISLYQENNFVFGGLEDTCPGLLAIRQHTIHQSLVRAEDEDKLQTIELLFEKIIKEVWGGFTSEHDDHFGRGRLEGPYISIHKYRKLQT